ncbi:MAG: tyrosine-protein phosphatase [Coriobacteriia bacterium]
MILTSTLYEKYGMRAIGDGSLRSGMLYRSRDICALTQEEASALYGLGVRTVYDLRKGWEVALYPEPVMLGMRHVAVMPPEVPETERRRSRLAPGAISKLGPPGAEMLKSYRKMVKDAPVFGAVLRSITHEGVPALVHCTNGKDRAGVLSAIIQRILGVSEAEVMLDYLQTNIVNAEKNERDFVHLGEGMSDEEKEILVSFFEARPEYLNAHFDAIDETFGSFETYVERGLGLDERDRECLAALCPTKRGRVSDKEPLSLIALRF